MRKARRNFPRKPLVKGKNRRMLDFFCVCWSIIHLRWEKRTAGLTKKPGISRARLGPVVGQGPQKRDGKPSEKLAVPSTAAKPCWKSPARQAGEGPGAVPVWPGGFGGSPAVGRFSRRPARKYDGYSHSTMGHRKSQQQSSPRERNVVRKFSRRRGIPSCILRDIGF